MTVAGAQDLTSVLSVENLSIALPEGGDRPFAVEQVSFAIKRNEVVCLVGESGSGKSMIAHAILSLLPKGVDIVSGAVKVAGQDTAALDSRALRRLRGGQAAMIFQEPLSSLNPLKRVGEQIEETILTHQRPAPSAADIKARVQELLTQVGLPNPSSACQQLSVRTLRRPAPARHDRDGDVEPACAADRGRADDGARCHHPAPDPPPDRRSQARPRHGRAAHHA